GESAVAAKHSGPVPAASAPLMSVFHKKPPAPPVADESAAQAPIPAPKFPPINFPDKQPATTQANASTSPVITTPSPPTPTLRSVQERTVFPGTGTPGAGTVPSAQNQPAAAQPATAQPAEQPLTVTVTQPHTSSAGAPAITTAVSGTTAAPAVRTA